ncbi:alpha/beta hydrolase [Sinorhizobium fredii]|uniref:alpha/beta hydrolase n=1 Tax=Rhizobium fredii TaxID=380 RepID=UPI0004B170B9|nr:alpha/beta hydrolase [Sinorhizobium fredii]AWM29584.1 Lipase/esterase [Sinorhizobium fredii CCBAU 25509]MCG5473661.1 alpha/beta hydrolase [Sinorhizobium fredii]
MNAHTSEQHGGYAVETTALDFVDRHGTPLSGTLYRPLSNGALPTLIAVHGGGWRLAPKYNYQHIGPYLAARGYAVFAPTYRLAKAELPSYPAAVHDVRAAVQFIRAEAENLGLDGSRLALLGDSSGAHLAALVALAGDLSLFKAISPNGGLDRWSAGVKACIPVYGIFDLAAQWQHDQAVRFDDHIVERFLGERLVNDRRPYFDASPLSHVSAKRRDTAFLVAWGTGDDVVDPARQSEAFVLALKQAGIFVRSVPVPFAPHYWISDPLDEAGSYSGFFAPRLMRFLEAKL